ncbi:MAG: type ISP restriction/modification enzyme [Rhizomicrobium sp.]
MSKTFASAISEFGARAKAKLSSPAIDGAPEDQLRNPLELLFHDLAEIDGLPPKAINLIGETALKHLKTRPDFAVTRQSALIGFVEVKAPGKGADPRKFEKGTHDGDQWEKLKSLPNLLYTDGNSFSLWQDGKLVDKVIHLDGDIKTSGAKLNGPETLRALVSNFFQWKPIAPNSAKKLAEVSARLCRLLRDEVVEQMEQGNTGLTGLAKDWRHLLFPTADDAQFADGYAQAVTFGLLVARARDIKLEKGIEPAAQELRKTNSLIGAALRILTDDVENQKALQTSLKTLTRVLDVVDWHTISKDKPEAWLYFYEDFLEVYDNALRKRTGSYYTPPEVVGAMVNLVDEALRGPLFERSKGLASSDVWVADPATGTGTFLLGVLRRIASTVAGDQGEGAVRGAIEAAAQRLIGFELQVGPFAVAQLRLMAEMQALMATPKKPLPPLPELRLYITDTLGNPFIEEETLGQVYEPVAKSRRDANKVKREQRITVVIGNPPYKNQAGGQGGWIEDGSAGRPAPMDRWQPPREWGIGAHAHHLKNLYVYFWRWATLKVFGSGWKEATGEPESDRFGVICFITVAGFLNGPGFQKMREDLRRDASDIWVIDCSPEGHQPDVPTRIFQGVQQTVCIVLAARPPNKDRDVAGKVHFLALPKGKRNKKFETLGKLSLHDAAWREGASDWRDPFLAEQGDVWASFPRLAKLFVWSGPGVKTHRTWVIAPDASTLTRRWEALRQESDPDTKELLFHPDPGKGKARARYANKIVREDLGPYQTRLESIEHDKGDLVAPIRYGFRSFDRQWIPPDNRLLSRPRPDLWSNYSSRQIFMTALESSSPTSGPAISLTDLIPDNDHYRGSFGGRVYPLWKNAVTSQSNVRPELLTLLAKTHGTEATSEDVFAYIAAVMAHPAFMKRFTDDLAQPGLRIPITADGALFARVVELGREVVWLHTYGQRFVDPKAGRPKSAPRLPKGEAPTISSTGAIPGAPEPLPDSLSYDPSKQRLVVGKGHIDHVTQAMWGYEVSGKQVVWQWFSYRKSDRSKPQMGEKKRPPSPLDKIQPEHWLPEYTDDLLDLLNVLGRLVKLEPAQAQLLADICNGPMIDAEEIRAALGGDDSVDQEVDEDA